MPRQRKDFLLNPFIIALVAVIVIIALFNFWQNMQKMNRLENEINNTKEEIAAAKAENEKLREQLKNTNDPEYIEEVAREKLGLVKPGEMLLVPVEEYVDEEDEKDTEED